MSPRAFPVFTAVLILLILPSASSANGYKQAMDGGAVLSGIGVVSASQGGSVSTSASDALALFMNPAGLSLVDGTSVAGSIGSLYWKEVRRYSVQRDYKSDQVLGMRNIALSSRLSPSVSIGAGLAAVADASYEGGRLVYNETTEEIEAVETLVASGAQWEALAGASYALAGWVSLGVSAGYRFGLVEIDYERWNNWLAVVDSSAAVEYDIAEPAVHVGAISRSRLATLGVSYSAGGEHLQPVVAFGAEILAPHLQNVTVGLEGQIASPLGRNDYSGRIHINYPIDAKTVLISSVSFLELPGENGEGMGFSLGGTRRMGPVRLDAAMHWHTRKLYGDYMPFEDADRVDDSTTEFLFGLSYTI